MSKNRFAPGRTAFSAGIAWVLAAGIASASVTPAHDSPSPDEVQAWPEVETVRTLLRADAAAALADCRMPGICQSGPSSIASTDAIIPPPDDIRVAAIFGVARRLIADVVVNGAMLRYQAGRAAPVAGGVSATAAGYQLLAIEGACVRLRRDAKIHTACLSAERATP
ncbi:hypothetical protein [Achromobacter marplatensis]|uniref:hypothetical protein n=1 Tax=Achromobacter marplatensis TaxID=470868 RepID=UPI0039F6588B